MKKTITLVATERASMRTPCFTPGLHSSLKSILLLIVLLWAMAGANKAQAQCTLACDNLVGVSLPALCDAEITFEMILESGAGTCTPFGPNDFTVTVMTLNGIAIPTSPIVTAAYIGQTLRAKVQHNATGNSCWGNFIVQDKMAPVLTCPPDLTVDYTASTAPANTGAATASDCSGFTLSYSDVTVNNGCAAGLAAVITRKWLAVDINGYSRTCSQTINILQSNPATVVFPPNRDGISGPALDCVNPNTTPANTGSPTINGQPIPNGPGFCNLVVAYADQTLPTCQNSYKIVRTWTVISWCTSAVMRQIQVIAVKDTQAPVLTCPVNPTVSTTSSVACSANVQLPAAGISDNCSTTFTTTMNTPAGLISGNGGLINNVGLGAHTIKYNVSDNCGNAATCTTTLTVKDGSAPTVICDAYTVVTLNNTGIANVDAKTFDDGSYDNCTYVNFSARRMDAGCGVPATFGPTVRFCCEDVGQDVMVVMQVTDLADNSNSCMVTVHVSDKTAPAISCPANKTIICVQDENDLALTGEPTVTEPCGTPTITHTDVVNLNMCYVGAITRTWKAVDSQGNSSSCIQTITKADTSAVKVVFPPNYAVSSCVDIASLVPSNLPAPYNAPVITKDCELMATNFTDQVFVVAAPACFKIVRTWKVINWCTYQSNSSNNTDVWEATQIIMVTDNTPPTFTCPNNMTVSVGADCKATLTLPQVTNIQDCSQNVTVAVNGTLGNGHGPFSNIGIGNYTATYRVADGCSNSSSCTINISVVDDKKPTPYCKNGLVIELMGVDTDGDLINDDGMAVVWASDFNVGSFDNCTGALQFSFSANAAMKSDTFDCSDVGQVPIQMWVTDAAGNQDFCETFLTVQDNMHVCDGPLIANISGAVTDEMGNEIVDVMVNLNEGAYTPVMTNGNGTFSFTPLQMGGDYTVSPEKNQDLLNGVTTFDLVVIRRHILGVVTLPTPYRIIAADVNHSNSITTADLVELQKLIVLTSTAFPDNKSWRFVRADYVFPDPSNPWAEIFPEVYSINDLAGDMDAADFVGIKVGDVNNTALTGLYNSPNTDRGNGALMLATADQTFGPGEEIKVDFTAGNFEGITGYQFSLHFDQTALAFQRIEQGALNTLSVENFGLRNLAEGIITTSWSSAQPQNLAGDAVLFSLVFRPKASGALSKQLGITPDYTPSEAYFENGGLLGVELQIRPLPAVIGGPRLTADTHPNPFSERAIVSFTNPKRQEVSLTVFGPSGRVVKTVQGAFEEGAGEFSIGAAELPGAGTYFYRLRSERETVSGKLVLVK